MPTSFWFSLVIFQNFLDFIWLSFKDVDFSFVAKKDLFIVSFSHQNLLPANYF